jgi:FkbM family methyltransferase
MNEARFDVANDPAYNGEREVQATILHYREPSRKTVVLDVHANVGDWTCGVLQQAGDLAGLEVHAFEPCTGTYSMLLKLIGVPPGLAKVVPVRKPCFSSAGTGTLQVVGVGAGTNSLISAESTGSVEQVELISIDDYCGASSIDHISLLKIDAEGHDIEVIKGATRMLQQNVDVLQF